MQYFGDRKKGLTAIALLSAAIVLTACGGGGGGFTTNDSQVSSGNDSSGATTTNPQGPTPPATQGLTLENFIEVVAVAFEGSRLFVSSVEDAFDGFSTVSTGPISVTTPAFCESGTGTITVNLGGTTPMAGDSFIQSFTDCVVSFEDGGQSRDNGEILNEVLAFSGVQAPGSAFNSTIRSTSNNFVSEEIVGPTQGEISITDGDAIFDISNDGVVETTVITSENGFALSTLFRTFNVVYNIVEARQRQDSSNNTIEFYSDHNFQLTTALTNGSFTTDTTQTFISLSTPELTEEDGTPILRPTSGFQITTDGNGASVSLMALTETSAEVSLDLDGDTIPEASQIVTYEQLEAIIEAFFI